MGHVMDYDSEDAVMLDNGARRVGAKQQAPLAAVECIDLQDNKYYNSRTYTSPSLRDQDNHIPTSQSWSNGETGNIQRKVLIHDCGSRSYNQNWNPQLNIEESRQDVAKNGTGGLRDVKARNNTTDSPGARKPRHQLQMNIGGNGADVKLNALSRGCQWSPTKHAKANAIDTRVDSPTLPRKRPHMCMTLGFQESDSTSESEAAKSHKPRRTGLQPLRRVQVHNGIANKGSDANADDANSHPPQKEQNARARPSNPPKLGFATLEKLGKPRPAPFGTLKIDNISHREKDDELFVSASDDEGQEGDRLCSDNPNVPGQKSYATQENIVKQNSPWTRQNIHQTQKMSRRNHRNTAKGINERESRRLARELAPTEACGVFSESRVPAGCSPAQHTPTPYQLKETRNMTCIICDSKFATKKSVRNHFPKCVQKNGNPNRHSWFDHPTIQNKDDITYPKKNDTTVSNQNDTTGPKKDDNTAPNKNDNTAHNRNETTVRNKNDTQSRILGDGFGPFSKKTVEEPTIDPSPSLAGLQADPETAVEHKTTGGKGISDATIASWLAAQSEIEDIEEGDDCNADNEIETSESAWQYHVTRQEIRTADLGLLDPIERKYAPYWTLEEANAKAGEEIQIRDVSPPPGPHSRGWSLQFGKDENGMDSHTVEVQGTTISTTVTRSKSSFPQQPHFSPAKSTNIKSLSTYSPHRTRQTPYAGIRIHNPVNCLYHPLRFHPSHHDGR